MSLRRIIAGCLSVATGFLAANAFAASITVNGICEIGTCTTSDVLASGASASTPFSFIYTFADTDRYQATGTIGASNNFFPASGGTISITAANITLSYLGNSFNTPSASDTLTVDFLQYFQTTGASGTNNSGFEYVEGNFSGGYSGASSVSAQAFTNGGTAMALMGPFSPPPASFLDSRTGQPASFGSLSLLDFRDTIVFGAGSTMGATITVSDVPSAPSAPEPSTYLLITAGTLLLLPLVKRRNE